MCKLCDEGKPQDHRHASSGSRRDFIKASTAAAAAAGAMNLFTPRTALADDGRGPPDDHGRPGRRYIIRGGAVMSMDPQVGDFPQADVLIEGEKIVAVGPNLRASRGDRRDWPHRHAGLHRHASSPVRDGAQLFFDGIPINDGIHTPSGNITYFEHPAAVRARLGRRTSTSTSCSAR
jgi:hypothetical protein